jgi:integrase/recombinase XerC
VVRYGKGGKTRRVPLNIEARKALADFPLPVGLSERRVQEAIAELGRRAGLEVTPHTLRHTFAKNLMDARQDITRVAALMGHANLNTTRIYTAPGERDLRQAVEALE